MAPRLDDQQTAKAGHIEWLLTDVDVAAVHTTAEAQIASAHEFAVAAPFPDPADAMRDVFTEVVAQ